ncbi:MAG: CheB methylesterase domain-containing protein, partial [Verrucomicrobiota bacterium]
ALSGRGGMSFDRFPPHIVFVGGSTGGIEGIQNIVAEWPANGPGLVLAEHMPGGFTQSFADRLNRLSAVDVREAREGDVVKNGCAFVAPGDRHTTVIRTEGETRIRLDAGPPVNLYRPNIDLLFRSAALLGGDAVGVLLSGMGRDGAEGLAEMRAAGAFTVAQDEASSAVFGMPGEAVRLDAASEVLDVKEIAPQVLRKIHEKIAMHRKVVAS